MFYTKENQMQKYLNLPILLLFALTYTANAQLAEGEVNVQQDPRITQLLEVYKKVNSEAKYYTIQVGFGSYREAVEIKDNVGIDFPQWRSEIVFDSPTYRVRVGRFRTKLEAERHFLEVREKYPQALLLKPEKPERKVRKPDSQKQ